VDDSEHELVFFFYVRDERARWYKIKKGEKGKKKWGVRKKESRT